MKNAAQAWFMGGSVREDEGTSSSSSPSLLADWNSYAASKESEENSGLGFDLEAAVKTANNKVTGTFGVVSKGVRGLPGSFNYATSNVPSGKSIMYFGLLLASGMFFIFLAFTMFLPVMVLMPQKFAICFTLGCGFIIGSFFALKGPKNQLMHMSTRERLPFTLGFIGSMVGTIYVSMVLHSYILSVLFSVLQVLALSYYAISYFPGGSAGLKFLTSTLTSSILKCFGSEMNTFNQKKATKEKITKEKATYKTWTVEETNILLKILVDGAGYNWRDRSGSFNKQLVETKVLPLLNAQLNCTISYVEYRSRFKYFQRRYKDYQELLKFSSGFGYDSTSKKFTADEEIWDNYLKSHPNHRWMKEACGDYEDICIVVGNKNASGKGSIGLNFEENDARTYQDGQSTHGGSTPGDCEFDDEGNFFIYDNDSSFQEEHESPQVPLPTTSDIPCEPPISNTPTTRTRKRARKDVEESSLMKKNVMENLSSGVVSVATNLEAIRGLME